MKARTPHRNGLLSIIPFFGYSSYVYLGKKLGFTGWGFNFVVTLGLVFSVTILGGIVMGFEKNNTYMVFGIVMPLSNLVQYFTIKSLTKLKHKKDDEKCCGFHSCYICKDTSPCDEKNCTEKPVTKCELCKEALF